MSKDIIFKLGQLIQHVELLRELDDETWYSPITEGKWRIHDMITHIMRWDYYFNETTFRSLLNDKSAELKEHPDYLGYNEQSIEYGRNRSKDEIINETIENRKRMIENLSALSEDEFSKVFPGERKFTLERYLTDFFTTHDDYHLKQIQEKINRH